MIPVTCIVVDDELKARVAFEEVVKRYLPDKARILASVDSVEAAVPVIMELRPQIIFLDIEMNGEQGFRLFDYFTEFEFEVIFVTSHPQYAVRAIKLAAFDYLLKPLCPLELIEAVARFHKKQGSWSTQLRISAMLSNLLQGKEIGQKIALPTNDGYRMELLGNIVYCEADVNYCRIWMVSGKTHLVSRTLKNIEEMLEGSAFFRIHKSYLVNLGYIKSYSRSQGFEITLENGTTLPVAQRKNDEFLKHLAANSKMIRPDHSDLTKQ